MIYTHTSNPSIDYYLELPERKLVSGIQRADSSYCLPGGKGLNVSMVLNQLGVQSTATAFIGGYTGAFIDQEMKKYPYIRFDAVPISQDNRINVKIRGKNETDINVNGPSISITEQSEMISKFKNIKKDDWILVCGSFSGSITPEFLLNISQIVNDKGANLVIDIGNLSAELIGKCKPKLVKPNVDELYQMFNLKKDCNISKDELAARLIDMGVETVLLSDGGKGAEYYTRNEKYCVKQKNLDSINTVGSGDSMLAAFVAQIARNEPIEEALKLAAAAGAATAVSKGLATKTQINLMRENIQVSLVKSEGK